MYPNRFAPGCCCSLGCNIFDDDFDRANNTNLGADWTEVDGDWAINDNNLSVDGVALCICDTAHPDAEARQIVTVDVKGEAEGDTMGIVLDYDDSDNYHYVVLEVVTDEGYGDAGSIKFYKVTAGVANQLGDTITVDAEPGVWYTLKACFSGTAITCVFDGDIYSEPTTEHGGDQTGLIVTVGGGGATQRFDDFDYDKHYSATNPECAGCGAPTLSCLCCTTGKMARLYVVTVAGFTNDGCADCTDINTTYLIDLADLPLCDPDYGQCSGTPVCTTCRGGSYTGGNVCPDPTPPASEDTICLRVCKRSSDSHYILMGAVQLIHTINGGEEWRFLNDLGTSMPNCEAFSAVVLNYDSKALLGVLGAYQCDGSSASMTVTAIL